MTAVSGSPIQIPTNRYIHLFYLVGPTTGSNNVVITADQTQYIAGNALSYTGAKQTGQPDNQGTATASVGVTTITKAITTVADNSWLMAFGRIDSGTILVGAATTSRVSAETNGAMFADGNAAITPAGSSALTYTIPITANAAMITASFAPAPAAAASAGVLLGMI